MIKFTIDTKEVKDIFKKLEVVRDEKASLPVVRNIKIKAYGDEVAFTATDLERVIKIRTKNCKIDLEGETIVMNIKKLSKAFIHFKEKETCFEDDGDKFVLSNGKRLIKYDCYGEDYVGLEIFNLKNEVEAQSCNVQNLINRLNKVKHAICRSEFQPALNGVYMSKNDMVAIDGYRMAINKSSEMYFENGIIIPDQAVQSILKLADKKTIGDIKITTDSRIVCFQFENIELKSRLLDGQYINYDQFIPKVSDTSIAISKDDLETNCKFLKSFIEKKDFVRYEVKNNSIHMSLNLEEEEYSAHVEGFEFNGNEIQIGFNNEYILDMLKSIDEKNITLNFTNNLSPLIVKPNESETYLVLPVRLSK